MLTITKRLWRDEGGQGIIEYVFILIFVSLALIFTLGNVGTSVVAKFQSLNDGF